MPLSAEVMIIQLSLLAALHPHPPPAFKEMLPLPPLMPKKLPAGASWKPQMLPTLNPLPKLVTHISLVLKGLKKTRSGWRKG